ncbi:hypothetical protein ABTJ37_22835, partial [Acinetobacter baumannii]
AWQVFAHGTAHADTIFTSTYYTVPEVDQADDLLQKWHAVRAVRAEVTKQLEAVRAEGGIGSSLQAEVSIQAGGPALEALSSL